MRVIRHIIRKEFLQIFRDPMMLRAMFFMPIVQLFVLGYAITYDIKNVNLLIRDLDNSQHSRLLLEKIEESGRFRFVGRENDPFRTRDYFLNHRASLSLAIPRGFERDMLSGENPGLQILVDGVDSNSSNIALGYLLRITGDYVEAVGRESGVRHAAASENPVRVRPVIRAWFNPNLESKYYMLPGIVAILLTMTTSMLSGLAIVREREIGTLEQLNVTPIRPRQLMIGKITPFFLLSFVMLLAALAVVRFWYGIPMQGSVLLLLALSVVFLLSTLGVGIFVSTVTGTQQEAMFIIWAFNIFAILMSGMIAPIENMPALVQKLTWLNPVRYYMNAIRDIYLKGSGIEYLWKDGLALVGWGVGIVAVSAARFRKKLD